MYTPVIFKVLELLLLDRLNMVLEAGLPHINPSMYIKVVSYDDAIFATQEVIVKYVHDSSSVFRCLHDIQKVFDSVMYCVLLERLFSVGVSGKCGGCCVLGMTICDAEYIPCYLIFVLKGGSILSRTLFYTCDEFLSDETSSLWFVSLH